MQDLLPTLIDLCDLERPEGPAFDGISLAPVLRGEVPTAPADRMLAVNFSRMPGQMDFPSPDSPARMRREGSAVLWKRWRLIGGSELYDLETDFAQTTNVIDQHPDVAETMQAYLDEWWASVEAVANTPQWVIIGSEHENPATLTACEWWDVFVDQQRQIRIGQQRNSYWHVDVAQAGTYTFDLMRWPEESGLALTEACPAAELTDGHLEAGVALPIARARLMINEQSHQQEVPAGARSARFTVELPAGRTLLHTWFADTDERTLCGAYYVRVERQ